MGVSDNLTKEVKGIALMVVLIIVFSIVLVKFKSVGGAVCPGATGTHGYYNASADVCCFQNTTNLNCVGVNQSAINSIGTAVNNAVDYLDEPVTWISVIIIILVVAWLVKYLKGKSSGM